MVDGQNGRPHEASIPIIMITRSEMRGVYYFMTWLCGKLQ